MIQTLPIKVSKNVLNYFGRCHALKIKRADLFVDNYFFLRSLNILANVATE